MQVVLAEKQQCPFTNQPLQFEQLKVRRGRAGDHVCNDGLACCLVSNMRSGGLQKGMEACGCRATCHLLM